MNQLPCLRRHGLSVKNKKTARRRAALGVHGGHPPSQRREGSSRETRRHGRLGQDHWHSEVCPRAAKWRHGHLQL